MPVAFSLASRCPISIERMNIFSSIGRLEPPFREDLPPLLEDAMILDADGIGDASPDVVDPDPGYGILDEVNLFCFRLFQLRKGL